MVMVPVRVQVAALPGAGLTMLSIGSGFMTLYLVSRNPQEGSAKLGHFR